LKGKRETGKAKNDKTAFFTAKNAEEREERQEHLRIKIFNV